jgi:hypothetical protein
MHRRRGSSRCRSHAGEGRTFTGADPPESGTWNSHGGSRGSSLSDSEDGHVLNYRVRGEYIFIVRWYRARQNIPPLSALIMARKVGSPSTLPRCQFRLLGAVHRAFFQGPSGPPATGLATSCPQIVQHRRKEGLQHPQELLCGPFGNREARSPCEGAHLRMSRWILPVHRREPDRVFRGNGCAAPPECPPHGLGQRGFDRTRNGSRDGGDPRSP